MADNAPMTRREMEEKIVALAWKDDDFREKFLADPKKQFEARLGTKLPDGLVIAAHAENENHLHFVIPAKPATDRELSDSDLEKVAGGVEVVMTVTDDSIPPLLSIVSAAGMAQGGAAKSEDW